MDTNEKDHIPTTQYFSNHSTRTTSRSSHCVSLMAGDTTGGERSYANATTMSNGHTLTHQTTTPVTAATGVPPTAPFVAWNTLPMSTESQTQSQDSVSTHANTVDALGSNPHNLIPRQAWVPPNTNGGVVCSQHHGNSIMNLTNGIMQHQNSPHAASNGSPGHPPALIQAAVTHHHQQQQQQLIQTALRQSLVTTANSNVNANIATPTPTPMPHPTAYTVQDCPTEPPIYNGVNPTYPGLRVVHTNPPMFAVDNFLTDAECDFLIHHAHDSFGPAPVVGKGAGEVSPSRTSSTCYLAREDVPDLLRKVTRLTGKPIGHCELPQVGRYLPSQQYLQHYDAFDLSTDDGRRFAAHGGQRTVTVLMYLNTVPHGGATHFPALSVTVQPVRGMALVFFPATVHGRLDRGALHAAWPAAEHTIKYVSQVWIRQSEYAGQPSKRLSQTMGLPWTAQEWPTAPLSPN